MTLYRLPGALQLQAILIPDKQEVTLCTFCSCIHLIILKGAIKSNAT